MGIEGALLIIIKTVYEKPTANIIFNRQKNKSFPLKIRNKTRVFIFITLIQHSTGSSSHRIRQEGEIKGIQIGKEEGKLSFADDMIVYKEKHYSPHQKTTRPNK